MKYNVPRYFQHKKIESGNIKYIIRANPHTVICLFDGQEISTTIPMKEILTQLPPEDFLNITKGVALRKEQIVHISDEGAYTMTDGRVFRDVGAIPASIKKFARHCSSRPPRQKTIMCRPWGFWNDAD